MRVASTVGKATEATSELTASTAADHAPLAGPREARSVSLPSSPTVCATLSSSRTSASFSSTSALKASATSASRSPAPSVGSRTVKSPCRAARSASRRERRRSS